MAAQRPDPAIRAVHFPLLDPVVLVAPVAAQRWAGEQVDERRERRRLGQRRGWPDLFRVQCGGWEFSVSRRFFGAGDDKTIRPLKGPLTKSDSSAAFLTKNGGIGNGIYVRMEASWG